MHLLAVLLKPPESASVGSDKSTVRCGNCVDGSSLSSFEEMALLSPRSKISPIFLSSFGFLSFFGETYQTKNGSSFFLKDGSSFALNDMGHYLLFRYKGLQGKRKEYLFIVSGRAARRKQGKETLPTLVGRAKT